MTLENYITVIEDLSRDLPAEIRYRRLLEAIRQSIPCDAVGLLRLQGDHLRPVAFNGLREEARGRRFLLSQHPRLEAILGSRELVRFPVDCELPDPYDGLIHVPDGGLHVHDCMGVSIYVDEQPWGVITLDAVSAGQFDGIEPRQQELAISLTRAVVTAVERIEQLQQQLKHGHQVTAELNRELAATEVIGRSTAMQRLLADIETVAPTSLAVLIEGETGVGKEVVARRLHVKSDRYDQPLVQINCAALPETLAEAELFGHTRGAFTGANEARSGRFELADGGTLFLDEIGELPLALQATMLRALQEGEVQRMGSDTPIKVDVRIIAATNRDLLQEVEAGRFRADLYHRLSVFPVTVPPLRERTEDILQLTEYFLERDQHRFNIHKLLLAEDARQSLLAYSWPGNVRELEHSLGRAALKASREQQRNGLVHIHARHLDLLDVPLPPGVDSPVQPHPLDSNFSLGAATRLFQAQMIEQTLAKCGYNIAATARELQLDRSNLLRMTRRLGVATGK